MNQENVNQSIIDFLLEVMCLANKQIQTQTYTEMPFQNLPIDMMAKFHHEELNTETFVVELLFCDIVCRN
jgi:hypothetical protein